MKTYEVNGYYGSGHTPCIVFVAQIHNGCWYAVEGSQTVNFTPKPGLNENENVERLPDTDCFTRSSPINSLSELVEAIEG